MYFKDVLTTFYIRTIDRNLSIETSRTEKGRVQNVRTVRCSNNDDTFFGPKTIHLNEQLVEGLFTFIMTSTQSSTPLTSHGINIIDEYDTWSDFLGILYYITDDRCIDTYHYLTDILTTK